MGTPTRTTPNWSWTCGSRPKWVARVGVTTRSNCSPWVTVPASRGALALAAKEVGADVSQSVVRSSVGIGPEGESFALTVKLEVYVPGLELDQVQALANRTHELCPYSKATRGNVPVEVVAVASL